MSFLLKNWRLFALAGVVAVVLGGLGAIYNSAWHAGFDRARTECEAEKHAQEEANRKAIDEAAKKLDDLEQQLQLKDLQLDDYLKALDLAADQAPGSTDACLDAGSVRRLSAIQ